MRRMYCLLLMFAFAISACSDDTDSKQDKGTTTKQDKGVADKALADQGPVATCGTSKYLPADKAVGDFTRDGAVKAAADGKGLQVLINGGSEKYEKNKFNCMVLAKYKSATVKHTVEVWLFDQTDAAGNKAAYDASKHPDDVDITPVIGDAARENSKLLFDYTADMRLGQHLARIKIDDKAEKGDGPKFLEAILKAIKSK